MFRKLALFLAFLMPFAANAAIDLNNWKITLPVDKDGGITGKAFEIKPAREAMGYFYEEGGGYVFRVPVEGARTSGSKYPRSELRELKDGKEAAWKVKDGGLLTVLISMEELPVIKGGKKGRIVIGQIHGPNDELCRLYYDNGNLYFYDDKAGAKKKETKFQLASPSGKLPNIPLHEAFTYSIEVKDGTLRVVVKHKGEVYAASEKIGSFWKNQPLYYKAGAYVQVGEPSSGAGTIGSGTGKVKIYDAVITHGSKPPVDGCVCP